LVGIIFDGNLQSLVNDYAYAERQGRAVAVDVRALLEALRRCTTQARWSRSFWTARVGFHGEVARLLPTVKQGRTRPYPDHFARFSLNSNKGTKSDTKLFLKL
jgi:hypothetical protein